MFPAGTDATRVRTRVRVTVEAAVSIPDGFRRLLASEARTSKDDARTELSGAQVDLNTPRGKAADDEHPRVEMRVPLLCVNE
jgi:hypothetical protein